jgi:5-deoxy-5-amino-3-dehydroquinate synthase
VTPPAVRTVRVELGDRSYDVVVGSGARSVLADLIPTSAKRVAIVTQDGIDVSVDPGREHRVFTMPAGEAHKSLATVESLARQFAAWGMTRADCVVAVGGGIVTDVAGFTAASYLRGIAVVHVPTTLLGMIDAAIGGKTGVNLPEGKNLFGAFWQPSGVVCDLDVLATLPPRELNCGNGEMAKYHFLTSVNLAALNLTDRVAECVAIKAAAVSADERETISSDNNKGRAVLNYGHTLAHALEIATDHALLHGEAVAIGLAFAARLGAALGRIDADRVAQHDEVLAFYGLADRPPAKMAADDLLALMRRDKKAINGLTFVLDGPDGVELVRGVSEHTVRAVLQDFGAS